MELGFERLEGVIRRLDVRNEGVFGIMEGITR